MTTPQLHYEIAQQRQAELMKAAHRERLATQVTDGYKSGAVLFVHALRKLVLGKAEVQRARVPHPTS